MTEQPTQPTEQQPTKPTEIEPQSFYSQKQIAEILNVNPSTINRYIARNKIKGTKSRQGREILYSQAVVDKIKADSDKKHHRASRNLSKPKPRAIAVNTIVAGQIQTQNKQLEQYQEQLRQYKQLIDSLKQENDHLKELIKKNNDLQQQQLDLEKQRIDIERQKLDSMNQRKHWWNR